MFVDRMIPSVPNAAYREALVTNELFDLAQAAKASLDGAPIDEYTGLWTVYHDKLQRFKAQDEKTGLILEQLGLTLDTCKIIKL